MSAGFVTSLFSLEDRVAVVTGASSGICRHMALTLARGGASVIGVARRAESLQSLVDEVAGHGGRAEAIVADLAGEDDWQRLAGALTEVFGAPDILINGAGVNLREPADEVTQEGWNATLQLNLSVPFFLAQALVPGMREKGGGNIINMASLQSFRAFENGIAYGASKGGVAQLTRAMAQAWSRDGITANAIAPGFYPTELTAPVFGDAELSARHAAATAVGRNGRMEDLDGLTVFLASRASSYITGQVIGAEGGYLAK
jgi:NAD(P)-dependent dehydrogenase (short-subunit alcohol dehydrogenase family)